MLTVWLPLIPSLFFIHTRQVEELANPSLKRRHWDEIFALIGADMEPNEAGTGGVI